LIRSIYFPAKAEAQHDIPTSEMKAALSHPEALLWVSLENADDVEISSILHDIFHFHPLAIEDCMNVGYQPPKVDDFGAYIFLIVHAIHPNDIMFDLETDELNIFLGENYLVTVSKCKVIQPVEAVFHRIKRDERITQNGSDFLCHAVLDVLVDEYMPIIDKMDEDIEWLEDQVLAKPNPQTMERIINLKHSIMSLRRIIAPMREVINRLSRDDFPMIDRQSRIYFRDIYDHLVRIQDLSDTIRDIVSGTMDIYLNSTSLRLNEVMKALTIVSTIFLPLSFLAGVYGMNFLVNYPSFTWKYGTVFFWGLSIFVAGGMLLFFKRRGWF
jgi:magnesium transporter